ncbi:hypothetical protein D3C72_305570 [compost metagenome]
MARNLESAFKAYVGLSFVPLVAFIAALVADLAFLRTGDPHWYEASLWAIALGLVSGVAAGVPGAVYFVKAIPRRDTDGSKLASALMVLDVAVLSLFAFNLALRLVMGPDIPWAVWLGTYLTVFGVVELAATAFLAWNLWRRRQKRLQVAMLRGEQKIEASRRR